MPLDGYTLNYLVRSLGPLLIGGRVDKISQPKTHEIILHLRNKSENYRLRLDASPSHPCLMLLDEHVPQPKQALHFCMFLRKTLSSAKLLELKTLGLERIVLLKFSQLNELGDQIKKYLVFEIMGRHSNIIVLNEDKIILDSLTHVDEKMSSVREILPTRSYVRPPHNNKLELNALLQEMNNLAHWRAAKQAQNPAIRLYDLMMTSWQGFSPFMAKAFLTQIGADTDIPLENVTLAQLQSMKNLLQTFQRGENQPSLYQNFATQQWDYHAFSFTLRQTKTIARSSMMCAMQEAESKNKLSRELTGYKNHIQQRCKQQLKQGKRKENLYLKDIKESENHQQYLHWGELLTTHLHLSNVQLSEEQKLGLGNNRHTSGEERFLRVENLHHLDNTGTAQEILDIPLLAGKTPGQTAQIYFKTYSRLQEKHKQSSLRLKEIQEENAYIKELLEAGERIESREDFQALSEELDLAFPRATNHKRKAKTQTREQDLLHPGKPGKKNKWKGTTAGKQSQKATNAVKPTATSILKIQLRSGHILLIGRNNIQNDQLSLKIAHKNDLWFHVKTGSGSHVILRNEGAPIDDFIISEAAAICAWYNLKQSEREHLRRYQGQAVKQTIVYCPASHLFKAKGAKPGHILYENYQDITVLPHEPEEQTRDN